MHIVHSLLVFLEAIAPLLGVLILLSFVSSRLLALLGRPLTLTMGFLAVPLHELSHLLVAVLCGHKIEKVNFFWPSSDGRLGYVSHSYQRRWYSPFALLLIGLAPLFGGALAVYLATYLLVPSVLVLMSGIEINSISSWFSAVTQVLSVLAGEPWIKTVCWSWIMLSILLFSVPSKADFKGCFSAVALMALLFVLVGFYNPDGLIELGALFSRMFGFMVAPLLSGAVIIGSVFAVVWILLQFRNVTKSSS